MVIITRFADEKNVRKWTKKVSQYDPNKAIY